VTVDWCGRQQLVMWLLDPFCDASFEAASKHASATLCGFAMLEFQSAIPACRMQASTMHVFGSKIGAVSVAPAVGTHAMAPQRVHVTGKTLAIGLKNHTEQLLVTK
jgi:hypothetical protein